MAFRLLQRHWALHGLQASLSHSWRVRASFCAVCTSRRNHANGCRRFTTPTCIAEQVEDDDEVLMIMAEQLGGFVELMGGYAQAAVLVDILGSLATVEETIVREKVRTDHCSQNRANTLFRSMCAFLARACVICMSVR